MGAKLHFSSDLTGEATAFRTLTSDEIVVNTNIGGRSTYQNAGRTHRSGAEMGLTYRFARKWRTQFTYTYVDATYDSNGNRLPGVPKNDAYASVRWGDELGWQLSANGQYLSDVAVNDVNTAFAPSYALFGVSGGYDAELPSFRLNTFVRLNNLFDRRYVGSVIVNDGNSRFFEPGPGFNVLAGFSVTLK
ncbi:MAG: TonB-dependent receptor [Gammaproteobacteria bacterium]